VAGPGCSPAGWEKLAEKNYTVRIISGCHAEQGSTDSLRTRAKLLGNRGFSDILEFAAIASRLG